MAIRVAVANHRGGVGKTTTTMMLAEGLALFHGLRVLVIDFDPQASLSTMLLSSSGVDDLVREGRGLWDLLRAFSTGRNIDLSKFIRTKASDLAELRDPSLTARVDLVSSHPELLAEHHEITLAISRRHPKDRLDVALASGLEQALQSVERNYDVILFDCPATTGAMSIAPLRLAHVLISPTVLDDSAFRSLKDFIAIVLKEDLGIYHRLLAFRVVVTMLVRNNPLQRLILDQLRTGTYQLDAFRRPVGHSVNIQRAINRNHSHSFRPAIEKYGGSLADVEGISGELFELITNLGRPSK